jgi:hypothetical protein
MGKNGTALTLFAWLRKTGSLYHGFCQIYHERGNTAHKKYASKKYVCMLSIAGNEAFNLSISSYEANSLLDKTYIIIGINSK